MRVLSLIMVLALVGCGSLDETVGNLNQSAAELMYGDAAIAGTLAPYPQSSGCSDPRCKDLDQYEARLYEAARSGHIKWRQLVDAFYQRRAKLFPSVPDDANLRELRAYQRTLAEAMDQRRITETQWVYLNERKANELRARSR